VPFLLVVHDEDDESLAVAAASGIGADEVVVALVLEHEAGIAVREAEQGLGGVAGVVAVRGHLHHGVRALVVFELCIAHTAAVMHGAYHLGGRTCRNPWTYAKHTDRNKSLTDSVVDMETMALGPVVERPVRAFHPTAVTADQELAPRAAVRRHQ
jgi:hypothetical protein